MARNMLDPKIVTESEIRELPLFIKIYGGLCIASGVISIPVYLMFFGYIAQQLIQNPDTVTIGTNPVVALVIAIVGISFAVLDTVGLIVFGISLIKNRRRHAARWSYALIVVTIIQIIIDMMLSGIGSHLIRPAVQLAILITLSITVDPSLRQERELQRRLRNMINREAARDAMLGRDETGEGFIRLNFFNLFWVFVACSVIGLVLETIWHMVVVEPGVYQDRAGLLFGPFSPIYGFGALLMTVALNRFYKKNPIIIFMVSACIGALYDVRRHLGLPGSRMDSRVLAALAQAYQPHPLDLALFAYVHLHASHAYRRRHDPSVARLLVRARKRPHPANACRTVLCRSF